MGKSKKNTKSSLNVPGGNQSSDKDNNGKSIDAKPESIDAKKDIPDTPTYDLKTEQLISNQTSSALLYLLFYTILMFTLPFSAFVGTRRLLDQHCNECSDFTVTALSVSASVVTMYIIIAAYNVQEYKDKNDVDSVPDSEKLGEKPPKKIQSKKNE